MNTFPNSPKPPLAPKSGRPLFQPFSLADINTKLSSPILDPCRFFQPKHLGIEGCHRVQSGRFQGRQRLGNGDLCGINPNMQLAEAEAASVDACFSKRFDTFLSGLPTIVKGIVQLRGRTTVAKWLSWGNGVDVNQIERTQVREFLNCVHDKSIQDGGSNPGRIANKARENIRAILSWAWEHDFIEKPPRFPNAKPQRDVAVALNKVTWVDNTVT